LPLFLLLKKRENRTVESLADPAGGSGNSGLSTFIGGNRIFGYCLADRTSLAASTSSAWLALAYLIIFGSVIAFTSFISALQLLSINIAMTYAFVNPVLAPVLAQILGGWVLGEPLTLLGTTMVILGVVSVFANRNQADIKEKSPFHRAA